jgi:hypothetical protein
MPAKTTAAPASETLPASVSTAPATAATAKLGAAPSHAAAAPAAASMTRALDAAMTLHPAAPVMTVGCRMAALSVMLGVGPGWLPGVCFVRRFRSVLRRAATFRLFNVGLPAVGFLGVGLLAVGLFLFGRPLVVPFRAIIVGQAGPSDAERKS